MRALSAVRRLLAPWYQAKPRDAAQKAVAAASDADDPWDFVRRYPAKIALDFKILAENHGLARSMEHGVPVSADGAPIPWYTYAAVEYLERFNVCGKLVFEYGCGHSSLYWARRGARVWSVEHDSEWHRSISEQAHPTQTVMLRQSREDYARAIALPGVRFDLVAVDGIWRNDCVKAALPFMHEGGLLLLDNADWYTDAAGFLRAQGLFEISFSGFGPVNDYTWTTSLFLRANVALQAGLADPNPVGGTTVDKGQWSELW